MEECGGSNSNKNGKKQGKKRSIWSTPQIELLCEIWEEKIKDLRGNRKNSHVYEEMRVILEEHGYSALAEDIKIRIHNLTARYRKEKALIGPSGGSPSAWPFYARVNRILGSFKIHNVSAIVEESIEDNSDLNYSDFNEEWLEESNTQNTINADSQSSSTEQFNSSQLSSPASPSVLDCRATKRKINHHPGELVEEFRRTNACIEKEMEKIRETDAKLLKLEEERNDILREMSTNSRQLNEALIMFLEK